MVCEPNSAHCLFLQIKFYWDTAVLLRFCVYCLGLLLHYNSRVELCDRDCM